MCRRICIIYSTVGRSIADIYDRGTIFTEACSAEVNMSPRSDVEAMDRPTVLYVIYCMVSAQQTNLLRVTAKYFHNDAIFHSVVYYTYMGPPRNTYFIMVAQSPYYMYVCMW